MRKSRLRRTLQGLALFSILSTALVVLASSAVAEETPQVGLIDQVVQVGFVPEAAYLIRETGLGMAEKRAASIFVGKIGDGGVPVEPITLACMLPKEALTRGAETSRFTFFLGSKNGEFAATPVKTWTREMLSTNSRPLDSIKDDIDELNKRLQHVRVEHQAVDSNYKLLRDRATRVAGIDEIVDLKMELERLKGFGEQSDLERDRLKALIEYGKREKDPEHIDALRYELLMHLKDAAQVTAMADRLNSRRRDAAVVTLRKKVALIKEMKSVDAVQLANTALQLRAKRQQLEAQLNPTGRAKDEQNDF